MGDVFCQDKAEEPHIWGKPLNIVYLKDTHQG